MVKELEKTKPDPLVLEDVMVLKEFPPRKAVCVLVDAKTNEAPEAWVFAVNKRSPPARVTVDLLRTTPSGLLIEIPEETVMA